MFKCAHFLPKIKCVLHVRNNYGLEGENGLFQSVLLKEVVIEPNVKLNVLLSSAIWATHLGRKEVWRRRQEPE